MLNPQANDRGHDLNPRQVTSDGSAIVRHAYRLIDRKRCYPWIRCGHNLQCTDSGPTIFGPRGEMYGSRRRRLSSAWSIETGKSFANKLERCRFSNGK